MQISTIIKSKLKAAFYLYIIQKVDAMYHCLLITNSILYSPVLFLTVSQSTDSKSKYFEIKLNKTT